MVTLSIQEISRKFSSFLQRALRPFGLPGSESRRRGLTLVEIVIVVSIVAGLTVLLATNVMQSFDNAKLDQAQIGMSNISQNLQLYRVHNGRFPTTEQGLEALVNAPADANKWRGPYIEEEKLFDPWGSSYDYECSDGRNFTIRSAGPDREMGTPDDITYPEKSEKGSVGNEQGF